MLNAFIQVGLFVGVLGLLALPLGRYIARVYQGKATIAVRWLGPLERLCYRCCQLDANRSMTWQQYAQGVIAISAVSLVIVFGLQRLQSWLPLNPASLPNVSIDSALNTAISFVTNTNWQGYGGESTMSYLTQAVGLTVQNFVSAAVGIAVLMAVARGFSLEHSRTIGNFWNDLVKAVVYVLLPLSLVLAAALVSRGVVQTWDDYHDVTTLEGRPQQIAVGPTASQIAIKQLGTNGGGFFNVNSAHPYENPTPLTNFLQVVAILLLPVALCLAFGAIIDDERQGWLLLAAMTVIFLPLVAITIGAEQRGNPALSLMQCDQVASSTQSGGNMEGKEARFGIVNSALWAVATTAASNGSVNSMHDSYTPIGALGPLWLMQLGEVVFGGVGSGLYGMLIFAIVTVFVAGLMVGRTPEYLGKKIGAFEMKMAALAILLPCGAVLLGTALAVSTAAGKATVFNAGPHGFSEVLYAFSSAGNNNGSAFAGLGANTVFYNSALGLAMWVGRFGVMLPVLGIAGSLASKKKIAVGAGTLPTHTPLFGGLLVAVVIVVGALSFFPALALGPIVEQLQLFR